MVDEREFHIGNFILLHTNKIHRLNTADLNFVRSAPKNYNPVILNWAILEAIGFVSGTPLNGVKIELNTWSTSYFIYDAFSIKTPCEHLHTLQNLYIKYLHVDLKIDDYLIIKSQL